MKLQHVLVLEWEAYSIGIFKQSSCFDFLNLTSWETLSTTYVGYTVLFSDAFFKASDRTESLQHSTIFRIGGTTGRGEL